MRFMRRYNRGSQRIAVFQFVGPQDRRPVVLEQSDVESALHPGVNFP